MIVEQISLLVVRMKERKVIGNRTIHDREKEKRTQEREKINIACSHH